MLFLHGLNRKDPVSLRDFYAKENKAPGQTIPLLPDNPPGMAEWAAKSRWELARKLKASCIILRLFLRECLLTFNSNFSRKRQKSSDVAPALTTRLKWAACSRRRILSREGVPLPQLVATVRLDLQQKPVELLWSFS